MKTSRSLEKGNKIHEQSENVEGEMIEENKRSEKRKDS